jgi:phage-related protein
MASRIAEAYVQIVPRIDGIGSGLTKGLSNDMGNVGEQGGQGFAGGFKKVIGPALALAAVAAIGGFVKASIAAGEAAATSNARIQNIAESMNLFGSETSAVTARLVDYANKQAILTGVDQNAIKGTQAKLLTFKELAATAGDVGGAFDRATAAAVDLAAAGFGSAEQNAVQLGKALQDPVKGITALARSGVTFTEQEKEKIRVLTESGQILEAQDLILQAIETQVGGTAAATANASDKIAVAMSQLKETVGQELEPAFTLFAEALIPVIQDLGPVLASIFGSLTPIFSTLAGILPAVGTIIEKLAPIVALLFEAFAEIIDAALPFLIELMEALMPIIEALIPPIIEVVKALLPLIPAAVEIVRALLPLIEMVLPFLVDWLKFLAEIIVFVADIIAAILIFTIDLLVGAFKGMMDFLPKVGQAFESVFKGIANFVIGIVNFIIGAFEGMVNFVIMGINLMVDALNKLKFDVPDWVPLIGGQKFGFNLSRVASISLGRVPALAKGGFVNKPTTALIGEAGPEVVIPLNRFEEMMGLDGNGQGKTINYYAAPNNSLDAEQALFQAIQRSKVVTGW